MRWFDRSRGTLRLPARQGRDRQDRQDGEPLVLHLIETPDVVAALGAEKRAGQWLVGFALETTDQRFRALVKLEKKAAT